MLFSESSKLCPFHSIYLVIVYIKISRFKKIIISSDSKPVLEAMRSRKFNNSVVLSLADFNNELQNLSKDIILCLIPSHIGIPGSEKADVAF